MKNIFVLLIGLALIEACGKNAGGDAYGPLTPQEQIDPLSAQEKYLELVNQHRKLLGLRNLVHSEVIEEVAMDYSETMAKRGWISHLGLGGRCKRIRQMITQGNRCGEILASGQKDAQSVFRAWLNSPKHREAIEDPNYSHTGFGHSQNREGKLFWSQMFLEIQ